MNSPWRAREKTFTLIIPHPLRERSQLLTKYEFYNCGYGVSYILLLLINPTPEFLSSHCSLRNSIPTCLGLFGYPVHLVRYANSICYRSLRNYGCYEFRFASLYRKSASRGGEFSLRSSGWHELEGLSKKQKAGNMKKSNCPLIKVNKWRSK